MMIGGETDPIERLDPIFATLAPGRGDIPRTPGREKTHSSAEQGYLHCGPSGAGHFVKMVHNGIEYGVMAAYAEGLAVLKAANIGSEVGVVDAETTPLREPELINTISSRPISRRSGGEEMPIASWLLDLSGGADCRSCARKFGPRLRPGEAVGPSRPRSMRECLPMCCRRLSTSGSVPAARLISLTSCSRPCATPSVAIWRSRQRPNRWADVKAPGDAWHD
jgi:hypothetical protein